MWLFLNNAALSIVESRDDDGILLVRGRVQGDIEAIFPGHAVHETPNADYRYRAYIDRDTVADAAARAVYNINYPNFKGSVVDVDRHDAYLGVWGVMKREQDRRHNEIDNPSGALGFDRIPDGF